MIIHTTSQQQPRRSAVTQMAPHALLFLFFSILAPVSSRIYVVISSAPDINRVVGNLAEERIEITTNRVGSPLDLRQSPFESNRIPRRPRQIPFRIPPASLQRRPALVHAAADIPLHTSLAAREDLAISTWMEGSDAK